MDVLRVALGMLAGVVIVGALLSILGTVAFWADFEAGNPTLVTLLPHARWEVWLILINSVVILLCVSGPSLFRWWDRRRR